MLLEVCSNLSFKAAIVVGAVAAWIGRASGSRIAVLSLEELDRERAGWCTSRQGLALKELAFWAARSFCWCSFKAVKAAP